MKKLTFGTPEACTPTRYCKDLRLEETDVSYPVHRIEFRLTSGGCLLKLPFDPGEHIYGLGLQLRAFDLSGRKFTLRPNADPITPTGDSHAPVPFFVSTAGYGVYVDTARHAEFYFGANTALRKRTPTGEVKEVATSTSELYSSEVTEEACITVRIPAAKGVDIYIFEGNTVTDVVAKYNMFSGGGCDVPAWALSAVYRCYGKYDQEEVAQMARYLKENGFSVGTVGLEPGWQSHAYPCTFCWNPEKFPEPQKLIRELLDMGFRISLWEHMFTHPASPIYEKLFPYSADHEVWKGLVPDFSIPEARAVFADHHKNLVESGIDAFKLDECDGSDVTGSWSYPNFTEFPGGMDGEQYHSMAGVLYMQAILEALDGRPTLSQVRNAGALSAPYPFVLYSDLYDSRDFIRGCAVSGFSGILWAPEVRDTVSRTKEEFLRRLQNNVFSVQCMINSWYCKDAPWIELGCAEEVKYWLNVRESLVPMLKEAFERYSRTGVPPVRALVSDYSDDENTYAIADQYLFCEKLLVAPIEVGKKGRKLYLPRGSWVDFFTGEPAPNGWFEIETDSIPVYRLTD